MGGRTPDSCFIRTPDRNVIRTPCSYDIRIPDLKGIRTEYPKGGRTLDCNVIRIPGPNAGGIALEGRHNLAQGVSPVYCDIALRSLALEGRHNTAQGVSPVCMSLTFSSPSTRLWRVEGGRGRGTLDRAHALSSVMSPLQGLAVLGYVALPGLGDWALWITEILHDDSNLPRTQVAALLEGHRQLFEG